MSDHNGGGVLHGYSRLGLSYRLTRVGLEKAARNWIQLELDSRGQQDNG